MRIKITAGAIIAAGIALLSFQGALWAHHAFAAEFDEKKPVKFPDATVTRVQLINPHSWIYVDVTMPDGKMAKLGLYDRGFRTLSQLSAPDHPELIALFAGIAEKNECHNRQQQRQ